MDFCMVTISKFHVMRLVYVIIVHYYTILITPNNNANFLSVTSLYK